ncbi:MAG: EamA family transporter, partial [Gemmataceae bacterium]|nr:EamA family transporter [Gemmataceae bacterium]
MSDAAQPTPARRPPTWALVLAFTLICLCWGTTFLAIKAGVRDLPPALFGGVRVGLAGVLLLLYLALRGESIQLPGRDLGWMLVIGGFLFLGGNGLINVAEKYVPSGMASVLGATAPLWIALLETLWPWGDRLRAQGWLGLVLGLGGVLVMLAPKVNEAGALPWFGPLLVLGSSLAWSVGCFALRHRRPSGSHLVGAAYQMILGGGIQTLLGLVLGEAGELTPERFTPTAVFAFFYLLIVGSLVGFVAFNWLLGHVSATLVGTHAYVNPVVAILVGWLLGGEELTLGLVGGMVVILAGVALVRSGGVVPAQAPPSWTEPPVE